MSRTVDEHGDEDDSLRPNARRSTDQRRLWLPRLIADYFDVPRSVVLRADEMTDLDRKHDAKHAARRAVQADFDDEDDPAIDHGTSAVVGS